MLVWASFTIRTHTHIIMSQQQLTSLLLALLYSLLLLNLSQERARLLLHYFFFFFFFFFLFLLFLAQGRVQLSRFPDCPVYHLSELVHGDDDVLIDPEGVHFSTTLRRPIVGWDQRHNRQCLVGYVGGC
jgi:hypothetical protein